MTPAEIRQVLLAPVAIFQRATAKEQSLFPDKQDGWFFLVALASGHRFVAHVPKTEKIYTFRTLKNKIPDLEEIVWIAKNDPADLGYITSCRVNGENGGHKALYEEILDPKPTPAPFLTKINLKHYTYHPMLERVFWIQTLRREYEKKQEAVRQAKQALDALLISKQKTNQLIQQQTKGELENVRN